MPLAIGEHPVNVEDVTAQVPRGIRIIGAIGGYDACRVFECDPGLLIDDRLLGEAAMGLLKLNELGDAATAPQARGADEKALQELRELRGVEILVHQFPPHSLYRARPGRGRRRT